MRGYLDWYCVGHYPTKWALLWNQTGPPLARCERMSNGQWSWDSYLSIGDICPSRITAQIDAERSLNPRIDPMYAHNYYWPERSK